MARLSDTLSGLAWDSSFALSLCGQSIDYAIIKSMPEDRAHWASIDRPYDENKDNRTYVSVAGCLMSVNLLADRGKTFAPRDFGEEYAKKLIAADYLSRGELVSASQEIGATFPDDLPAFWPVPIWSPRAFERLSRVLNMHGL